ncbi:dormancy-associated protein homolog 3-like isoform X2 [Telopea speciosissima]|uniref:dormancy-associated protein homolog 3-like isoform X2 n=1 Tax=Telopea speciosissima TaxID=54955 RepID=UPI001CC5509B|nr:dormancy-associated protein homolog 3-like isoform X2 [Telopea speciosissima]
MGLLDKLWDDTFAGPRPENGLGKLRKHSTFSFRSNSVKEAEGGNGRSYVDDMTEETTRVTRSIMIVKPPGNYGSPPVSPAGSTPPVSPFSGGKGLNRFRRRSTSDVYERAVKEDGGRSPPSSFDV